MPCRCDYEPYHEAPRRQEKTADKLVESLRSQLSDLGKKYNSLKSECDKVTQLLCYACGVLTYTDNMDLRDSRLIDWWEKHDEWDFNRTLETMKKEFRDSLTDRESIRAWFIREAEKIHPLSAYHKDAYFDKVYGAFIEWQKTQKNKEKRIAELEAELAKLKSEA